MIRESLEKRIYGLDRIDNILTNDALISRWLTCIMALGYNQNEVEAAAQDIFEMQAFFANNSIEDVRARVCQSQVRFGEEIAAFMRYVEMRDSDSDEAIERAVAEELEFVEEGDILFESCNFLISCRRNCFFAGPKWACPIIFAQKTKI